MIRFLVWLRLTLRGGGSEEDEKEVVEETPKETPKVVETPKEQAAPTWPLLWLSILRFSESSQSGETAEGFRLLFL